MVSFLEGIAIVEKNLGLKGYTIVVFMLVEVKGRILLTMSELGR